jgi:hypothetical protein
LYSSVLGLQGDGFRRDTENPREAGGTIVAGGAGADAFVFAPSVLAAPNPVTHIADYSAAQGDVIDNVGGVRRCPRHARYPRRGARANCGRCQRHVRDATGERRWFRR